MGQNEEKSESFTLGSDNIIYTVELRYSVEVELRQTSQVQVA